MSGHTNESWVNMFRWISGILNARIETLQDLMSGAAWCQAIHVAAPQSINLSAVRFYVEGRRDCIHNYQLLRAAVAASGDMLCFSILRMLEGDHNEHFRLGTWMRQYHTLFYDGRHYDAVAERSHRSFGLWKPQKLPDQNLQPRIMLQDIQNSKKLSTSTIISNESQMVSEKSQESQEDLSPPVKIRQPVILAETEKKPFVFCLIDDERPSCSKACLPPPQANKRQFEELGRVPQVPHIAAKRPTMARPRSFTNFQSFEGRSFSSYQHSEDKAGQDNELIDTDEAFFKKKRNVIEMPRVQTAYSQLMQKKFTNALDKTMTVDKNMPLKESMPDMKESMLKKEKRVEHSMSKLSLFSRVFGTAHSRVSKSDVRVIESTEIPVTTKPSPSKQLETNWDSSESSTYQKDLKLMQCITIDSDTESEGADDSTSKPTNPLDQLGPQPQAFQKMLDLQRTLSQSMFPNARKLFKSLREPTDDQANEAQRVLSQESEKFYSSIIGHFSQMNTLLTDRIEKEKERVLKKQKNTTNTCPCPSSVLNKHEAITARSNSAIKTQEARRSQSAKTTDGSDSGKNEVNTVKNKSKLIMNESISDSSTSSEESCSGESDDSSSSISSSTSNDSMRVAVNSKKRKRSTNSEDSTSSGEQTPVPGDSSEDSSSDQSEEDPVEEQVEKLFGCLPIVRGKTCPKEIYGQKKSQ